MKRKTWVSAILAVGVLLGAGAYPAVSGVLARTGFEAGAGEYGYTTDGWKYNVVDDHCEITGYNDFVQGAVTMPGAITLQDGVTTLPVTKVDEIFYSPDNITDLTVPASIVVIPSQFCEGKKNLKSITFEGTIISIPHSVFENCSSLQTVNLPEGVSSIGGEAFYGCTRLESIKLPSTVSTLGSYIFWNCESLRTITVPGSVTEIPESAFNGCTALASVTIEDGVKTIGGSAFANCTSLTEITFPKSVTSADASQMFTGCSNLESVTVENPDCELGGISGTEEKPLIIYGYDGSTAEKYCAEEYHHCEFKSIGEKPAPEPVAAEDTGLFCDADGDGEIGVADAQYVLSYYVQQMVSGSASWYEITGNENAPDAPSKKK